MSVATQSLVPYTATSDYQRSSIAGTAPRSLVDRLDGLRLSDADRQTAAGLANQLSTLGKQSGRSPAVDAMLSAALDTAEGKPLTQEREIEIGEHLRAWREQAPDTFSQALEAIDQISRFAESLQGPQEVDSQTFQVAPATASQDDGSTLTSYVESTQPVGDAVATVAPSENTEQGVVLARRPLPAYTTSYPGTSPDENALVRRTPTAGPVSVLDSASGYPTSQMMPFQNVGLRPSASNTDGMSTALVPRDFGALRPQLQTRHPNGMPIHPAGGVSAHPTQTGKGTAYSLTHLPRPGIFAPDAFSGMDDMFSQVSGLMSAFERRFNHEQSLLEQTDGNFTKETISPDGTHHMREGAASGFAPDGTFTKVTFQSHSFNSNGVPPSRSAAMIRSQA